MTDMRSLLNIVRDDSSAETDERLAFIRDLSEESRGERYRNVLEPMKGRWRSTIEIEKPLRAYHATHEDAGKVLTDRIAKTYDSMGTWLSSNREVAQQTYGPNIAAYEVPPGRYMMARKDQNLRELILNCLPMIERILGDEVADHITKYPDNAANRQWMADVRAKAKEMAIRSGESGTGDNRHYVRDILRNEPGGWDRYRGIESQHNMYAQVARSAAYSAEFKGWMKKCGYKGIIWNNRHWDTKEGRQTIFLIFEHEDLHPIEIYPSRELRK